MGVFGLALECRLPSTGVLTDFSGLTDPAVFTMVAKVNPIFSKRTVLDEGFAEGTGVLEMLSS